MLEKWARQSADYLTMRSSRPVVPEVLAYGLQVVYEHLVEILVWIVLGWMINDWLMWFGVMLGLILTRQAVGGVHAKRFSRCLAITIGTLGCGYVLSQLLLILIGDIHGMSSSNHLAFFSINAAYLLIGFAIFAWIVPVRWGERPYSKSRIWKHRIASALVIVGIFSIGIFEIGVFEFGTFANSLPEQPFSIALLSGSVMVMCLSTPRMQRWIVKS